MRAGVIADVGKVEVIDIPKPIPQSGELLIRVKACALCTHEQRVFRGVTHPKLPYLAGHEISGVVEECGENTVGHWNVGDRVVVRTLYSCGACDACRSGQNNHCSNSDGGINPKTAGLGEYMTIPEFQVFRLPDSISFYQGALTEPLACAVHSVTKADIDFGDKVVVIGAGIMGCFHAQLCKLRGAQVIIVEPDKVRRDIALGIGADYVIDPKEESQLEAIQKLTDGFGADVVVNTVAIPETSVEAISLVKRGGKLILFSGIYPNNPVETNLGQIHNKEISVMGSFSTESIDFIKAIKLQNMHRVEVESFIKKVVPLSDLQEAFELTKGAFRVVVDMEK